MKATVLFIMMAITMSLNSHAQTLEHFKIDTIPNAWVLEPTFDKRPQSGVNGMAGDESRSILNLIKDATNTLPAEIKLKLVRQRFGVNFLFNGKGEIFHITFFIDKTGKFPFSDEECLKIYYTIRNLKVDISKLRLMDNFEWGDGGIYLLNKHSE